MGTEKEFINLGEIVVTIDVAVQMSMNPDYGAWVMDCLKRYISCDWGDVPEVVKPANDKAALRQQGFPGRVVAKYDHKEGDIIIVTDITGTETTILFWKEFSD
jgi:hypothetical protein